MAKLSSPMKVPPLTDEMYERGRATAIDHPTDVVSAKYVRKTDMLSLRLRNGIVIQFPRKTIREIANAAPHKLQKIDIQAGGDGISIRAVDVDIYVPGLLADELGGGVARALGRKTRGRTSAKKAAASRENGRKGGRPKKNAA